MSDRGWALRWAAVLGAVEAAALITVVVWNGGRAAGLVVTMLAMKFPFCIGVARRWAAAWFGLLLWELAGMLAAVTAPGTPLVLRLAELTVAAVVVGLLALGASLFPDVRLPQHDER